MTQCSICLSIFRDPVCIPCGHVFCKTCLKDYANAPGNNGLTANCPECRASFELVVPDLLYLPEKYHKFVTQSVRRIYVDVSPANNDLRDALKASEQRLARKAAIEQVLLQRCEELTEALHVHRQGERDANIRIMELEDDLVNMEKRLQDTDDKVADLQRMHGHVMDKIKCVEKSNQVLQNENVRLSLSYHDIGIKLKEKESESNLSPNQTTLLSSSQPSVFSAPKRKGRKYVVRLPHGPTQEDTPLAISTSANPAATTVVPSRPIKPLPKRHGIKKRLIGDSSFMSLDVSDFV